MSSGKLTSLACIWFVLLCCESARETLAHANHPAKQSREGPIAIGTTRIERDNREVHIRQAKQPVELPPFIELIVVIPIDLKSWPQDLVGEKIAIVRSLRNPGRWEVHTRAVWVPMYLAENVFVVKKAFYSTSERPVEVRVNGKVHQLKSGQVLLVLG
jgi:hypothetical protein